MAYIQQCKGTLVGERDTIRGVQIRAGAVYIYKYIYIFFTRLVVNKHWQFSAQTNFLYLGRVNVCMITGTCCS